MLALRSAASSLAAVAMPLVLRLFGARSSAGKKAFLSRVPRAAHWVIRCGDLRKSYSFFRDVFGFTCIRHEENNEPCGITSVRLVGPPPPFLPPRAFMRAPCSRHWPARRCNGRFNNAWSKTMVGVRGHLEDAWYCLEVAPAHAAAAVDGVH